MKIDMYQVDAFADKLFSGNPAAVCLIKNWLSDDLMQKIASENNLSETAFVCTSNTPYQIRWFTPTTEVNLCGHATLASALVLFTFIEKESSKLELYSPKSGPLEVNKENGKLFLNFPIDIPIKNTDELNAIAEGIGTVPLEVYRGKDDFIAVFETENDIKKLNPNFQQISKLNSRGLIVTAKGDKVDFVSRYFAPQVGVNEDPVTGSAHTVLIPLWSSKLNKNVLKAKQLSKRGGKLDCINQGDRCIIGGHATLYLEGYININQD